MERDGHAGVRDAVGEVDGSVDWVNHPTVFSILSAGDAFLAEQGDVRESAPQGFLNQPLAADIQLKLDVVLRDQVRPFLGVQMAAHQHSHRLSGPSGCRLRLP